MSFFNLGSILLTLLVNNLVIANDAITTMADYSQHAMTELAASPPIMLLHNEKGKSRHEVITGYIKTMVGDNATLSTGQVTQENGDAAGFGLGYGYSNAFKDKWSFFIWFQAVQQSGDHVQSINGVTTTRITDMETVNANLALGISYEFFRSKDKHVLNIFGGPSLLLLEVSGAIQTYNTSGSPTSAYDGSYDGILPAVMFGFMYDYKFFQKFQIAPYGMIVYSLAEECQTFRVDNISLTDGNVTSNSPLCGVNTSGGDGLTDISPSFATIGIKFNYIPWNMGLNISGILRDALLRSDDEERAQVKGAFLSLTKSWE